MRFIKPDQLTTIRSGDGYTISELAVDRHPHLRYLKRTALVTHFDGLGYYLDYLPKFAPRAARDKQSIDPAAGFATYDYTQALEIFTNTPSKVRQFTEKDTRLEGGDVNGFVPEYDVTGDTLDVGRYLDGEPEVFSSLVNGNPRAKRVHLFMALNQWAGTTPDYILERSKRVVRLVDWLESQSVRVQITGVQSNECYHMEVDVKQYHEPLDLNSVAVMGHSDFLRRLGFRMVEQSQTYSSGYGSSVAFRDVISVNPGLITPEDASEVALMVGNHWDRQIDEEFDQLEATLASVLSGEKEASTLGVLL